MRGHPGTVFVPTSSESGLRRDSLVLVFQVRTIDRIRCEHRLSRPSEAVLDRVWDALYGHFQREPTESD
jgi:mRNA-degrading endonuclease toxin of MazEF toxin-antitoxin module